MKWIFIAIAFAAGACATVQVGVNNTLRAALGDPVPAALVSFVVGTAALAGYVVLTGTPMPLFRAASSGPGWMWFGGLLGAVFVAASILVASKIGAAGAMVWIIAAQLITSLALDHLGVFGFDTRVVSPPRIVGAVLLFAGAYLVSRY